MTGPLGVDLFDADRLRLVEAPLPRLSPEGRRAMDEAWNAAVRVNPALFDGPVAGCTSLDQEEPKGLVLTWVRATYRLYTLRKVPGATVRLPSLFVAVAQPADDGRLLVGRMAPWTTSPGRWQFPGGSVEPPPNREPLDLAALRPVRPIGCDARGAARRAVAVPWGTQEAGDPVAGHRPLGEG
ncbi:NUDIX hydrolase [Streptomyces kebangsaanensis]|uniref:NUDIX hydrolase n=1 Tax=Streptomyces kebangsaanensis TaxID=864058 RepID=UPI001F364067|nr:NUDIX hydrolase [Streptomyces kebangsaanensis]